MLMQMVLLVVVEIQDHRWYHHSDPDEYQQQCRLTKLENTFHDSSPLQIANLVLVKRLTALHAWLPAAENIAAC